MKKAFCLLCVIAFFVLLVCGCTQPEPPETPEPSIPTPAKPNLSIDLTYYPIYDVLTEDDKIIWNDICTAIQNHSTERIHIGTYTSEYEHTNAQRRFGQMYRELVYTCPDYFWVNLYDYDLHTTEDGNIRTLELELKYVLDEDTAKTCQQDYDAKVEEIVSAAKEIPDLFDRVLYVYDTLMSGAEYDHELAKFEDEQALTNVNLSSYGCLVAGKTVCSGYALAFRSIMDKLDVECGVEFNSYQYLSTLPGHVWNYCKLDGEYYYFDLTWDDSGMEDIPTFHLYFGISREDMELASYFLTPTSPIPECNGKDYNYYRYQGLSFPTYDYAAVRSVVQAHRKDSFIVLRFNTVEQRELAKKDLIDNGRIFDILPNLYTISYFEPGTDLHLVLLLK